MLNAKSVDEFLNLINQADSREIKKEKQQIKKEEELAQEPSKIDDTYDIVAVTACPAGLSRTYMAAEALENKAKELGIKIKVETDGAAGNRNRLLPEEIAKAKGVIVAADRIVEMDRFIGKKLIRVGVVDGIRKPQELIEKVLDPKCPVYQSGVVTSASSAFMRLYRHLMSGMTYLMPIAATAGILSALAKLDFLQGTQVGFFLDRIGYSIGTLLFPILSAFIAFSIKGRTALVAGFTGGVMADLDGSGVIGATVNGFVGGAVALIITSFASKFLRGHDAIVALLLYPIVGALGTSLIALFFTNIPAQFLNEGIKSVVEDASPWLLLLIGGGLAGMMSADMGGPLNKTGYAIGVLFLADSLPEMGVGSKLMGAVMLGGMIPPLAAGLSAYLIPQVYSAKEKKHALVALGKGLAFITEGVIPFLDFSPVKMKIACILSSAVGGALSLYFGCSICAPHGGIFVIPLAENLPYYLLSLGVATIFGAFLFAYLRLNRKDLK